MNLLDVHSIAGPYQLLFELLGEREPHQNISHRRMPTWGEHCHFVDSRPYLAWYLIEVQDIYSDTVSVGVSVGAVYLSKQREIGIGILRAFRGHGYGPEAIRMLMERHPGRFLANVAPGNAQSRVMFHRLGFRLIQQTYAIE